MLLRCLGPSRQITATRLAYFGFRCDPTSINNALDEMKGTSRDRKNDRDWSPALGEKY
jgi:hypothetical protein